MRMHVFTAGNDTIFIEVEERSCTTLEDVLHLTIFVDSKETG